MIPEKSVDNFIDLISRFILKQYKAIPKSNWLWNREIDTTMLGWFLNLSPSAIDAMVQRKELPKPKRRDGCSYWVVIDLLAWMGNRCLDHLYNCRKQVTYLVTVCKRLTQFGSSVDLNKLQFREIHTRYKKGLFPMLTLDMAKNCMPSSNEITSDVSSDSSTGKG